MELSESRLSIIRRHVGDITHENLKYVDCYVSENLSIYIPSVGFCEYAIRPDHTHPAYSFIIFFSKEQSIMPAKIKILPTTYLVAAIAPKMKHQEDKNDTFTRYAAIFISKEFYEKLYSIYSINPPENYFWNQYLVGQDIMIYIKKFMAEYENNLKGNESILEALSTIITHQIIRSVVSVHNNEEKFIEKFGIEKVIEYMNQNFGKKISIHELAGVANMSDSHFIRTFKKKTGTAPMEYLIKMRISKSKKLLRSNAKSISEISLQCGFNSLSHFSTCFMKNIGLSPSKYQNNYSKRD